MENYKVVMDEVEVDKFIEWLPDLTDDEVYYVCLFARSKYVDGEISHITSDKQQLKRFTANKDTLKYKLKQLECPIGSYIHFKTNVPSQEIPQEALACYITVNPRSLSKATKVSLKKFVDMLTDNSGHTFNPSNFAMSEIQRSKSRTCYVVFDVDTKDVDKCYLEWIIISSTAAPWSYKILETRGGYHVIVDPQKVNNKRWYNTLTEHLPSLDRKGDMMIPIPGTYQGGFVPKMLRVE